MTDNFAQLEATSPLEMWLRYIEKNHTKSIDMGLERVQAVAQQLDLLNPAPFVITVGGTNGKGTTCRLLELILINAGYRVGVYSSPHLLHYNERVRIQNSVLSDEQHSAAFSFIEQGRNQSLTYFEFSTLAALYLFKQAQLDIVILEVGLGGRLDATNIIDADISVITSIDLDHIEFLGDNRAQIGYEKAGIFRANKMAVIGDPDVPTTVLDFAEQNQTVLFMRNHHWHFNVNQDEWEWHSSQQHYPKLPLPTIPLANAATALAVCEKLPFTIDYQHIEEALNNVSLTGRFQTLTQHQLAHLAQRYQLNTAKLPRIILDVGHNPHAASYIKENLTQIKQKNTTTKIHTVFAMLADKDAAQVVMKLANCVDYWHFCSLDGQRGRSATALLDAVKTSLSATQLSQVSTHDEIESALIHSLSLCDHQNVVLVFGSFVTVGNFLQLIGEGVL